MARINVTETAEYDIERIENLFLRKQDPARADQTVNEILITMHTLEVDPARCPLVHDDLLSALGFRWIASAQYMIFYVYDEFGDTVHILRILHGRSNWIGILKGEPFID